MKWALILLTGISLVELLVWTSLGWRYRKALASCLIVLQSILVGLVIGFSPRLWTGLILIASAYRVINLLRLVEGRSHADYLFIVSRRTSLRLIAGQLVIFLLWQVCRHVSVSLAVYLAVLGIIEVLLSLVLLLSTKRSLRTTRPPVIEKHYASRDLPSVSVLIPARNETLDLEQCLSSLVASTYPKLEILVLDDCSQDKHTPEIIKSYAQAGVRFIAGDVPPESWLAKNFAYEQLSKQASGEIMLFVGVDTRFSPDCLTSLVESLIEKKKIMASIMPVNKLPGRFSFASCLIQPTRYAWELALPRRLVNRPPVLSTCWLIEAVKLADYGGFKAISRSNSPESYFARRAIRESDGYSFIRAGNALGLTSEKELNEQRQTAVRTRYPQTHRRTELVGLFSLMEAFLFFMPFFCLAWGLINSNWLVAILGVLSMGLLSGFYGLMCYLTYSRFIIKGFVLLPLAAIYDIGLLNYSMWLYEFREVIWKGRNVCLPIMRVRPEGSAQ